MADFEHLIKSYDVADQLDDIASADPPAYLRRTFAEGISSPRLSFKRVQQLAVCAMVLDAIVDDRDYAILERELIADWRVHYLTACRKLKELAAGALHRALEEFKPEDPAAAQELGRLQERLAGPS